MRCGADAAVVTAAAGMRAVQQQSWWFQAHCLPTFIVVYRHFNMRSLLLLLLLAADQDYS
jgi:hypothetical protein